MYSRYRIRSNQDLVKYIELGKEVNYLFFWKHENLSSEITKSCLSQWFESGFYIDNVFYKTAEHYMMAEKARIFGDNNAENAIINSDSPKIAKKIGRGVYGFSEKVWCSKRTQIVINANLEKFNQNEELKSFLVDTGNSVLVEASPYDKVWGVGLSEEDLQILDPLSWNGLNLLGYALMEVRDALK